MSSPASSIFSDAGSSITNTVQTSSQPTNSSRGRQPIAHQQSLFAALASIVCPWKRGESPTAVANNRFRSPSTSSSGLMDELRVALADCLRSQPFFLTGIKREMQKVKDQLSSNPDLSDEQREQALAEYERIKGDFINQTAMELAASYFAQDTIFASSEAGIEGLIATGNRIMENKKLALELQIWEALVANLST